MMTGIHAQKLVDEIMTKCMLSQPIASKTVIPSSGRTMTKIGEIDLKRCIAFAHVLQVA